MSGAGALLRGFSSDVAMSRLSSWTLRESVKRKSLVDEDVKMEEKIRSFELDLDRIYINEIIGKSADRMWVDALLELSAYQLFVAGCTLVSFVLAAVETDAKASGLELSGAVVGLGLFVIFVFAIDVMLRLYMYRGHFFRSSLNLLEASLLCLDVVLELSSQLPDLLGVLCVLKVLRVVRLARLLRSHAKTRELFLMIIGILASVRALIFAALLLLMTLTVFSILSVYFVRPVNRRLADQGVFGDCAHCEDAFDSVMNANLHFFTTIVGGDSWGRQAIPLIREDTGSAIIVIGALIVVNLGLLNTIAAVMVDRQVQARADDTAYMAAVQADELQSSLSLLQTIFQQMDTGGDDTLSLEELDKFYQCSSIFRSILNQLDIHKPDLPVIFKMLDTDDTGDLTFTEFVNGLHSLKNENLHTLMVFTKHYCESMFERFPDVGVLLAHQTKQVEAHFRDVILRLERIKEDTSMPGMSVGKGDTAQSHGASKNTPVGCRSASKCSQDSAKVRASNIAGRKSQVHFVGVMSTSSASLNSGGDLFQLAPCLSEPMSPDENCKSVEVPLPPDVASTAEKHIAASGSPSAQSPARSPAGVAVESIPDATNAGQEHVSVASPPSLSAPDRSPTYIAVPPIHDVSSTGEEHLQAGSSPRLKLPIRSAACLALSSSSAVLTPDSQATDIAGVKPQQLGVISHAPVGRRPPKPERLQE
eukprot:TRINITY_DN11262_c0_g1_i1.p1 TRINITY_DN11262_c0_g1~~TRINITY_DN11262_c0_g1_i1.p1  ORF type:complete len:704 (+),score=78.49 TRINITY_DN11262_c0_g1_i1:214-2325(+)